MADFIYQPANFREFMEWLEGILCGKGLQREEEDFYSFADVDISKEQKTIWVLDYSSIGEGTIELKFESTVERRIATRFYAAKQYIQDQLAINNDGPLKGLLAIVQKIRICISSTVTNEYGTWLRRLDIIEKELLDLSQKKPAQDEMVYLDLNLEQLAYVIKKFGTAGIIPMAKHNKPNNKTKVATVLARTFLVKKGNNYVYINQSSMIQRLSDDLSEFAKGSKEEVDNLLKKLCNEQ